ncbi:unnamed protein product [Pipistrellus nathusii]|uniref:Uncharacterized protein n=1 Tax=Pipistrellus nathusii TaxID=59473 RepID=A0ABN9ZW95_PIPNA
MREGQAPPGSSWGNHPPGERPSPAGGSAGLGSRRGPAVQRHHTQLLQTEKSSSVLSFHWKEELLLRRQLGLLDAMKKRQASARLTEQKAFYGRSHAQLQRVELAHARLRGDRDLVQRLSCPTRWSSSSGPSEESGAAVQAILQGRLGSAGAGTRHCSQEAPQHPVPIGGGQPGEHGARAASRGVTKAEDPWWVLTVEAQSCPEPAAQPSEPPGQPPPQAHEAGRQPEGKLLLYVMHGVLDAEPPERKRPRPGECAGSPGPANARPHGPHRDSAPRAPRHRL